MEIRKVQMTGGSSFIITLPKEWTKAQNIKKNEPLGLVLQQDGTLLITPKITGEQTHRKKVLHIDDIDDQDYFFRLLVSSYVMGYSEIEVKSGSAVAPWALDIIRNFVQVAVGPEIVEETDRFVVIKDLLSPTEMPFDKTIRRMHNLARNMHQEAIQALLKNDESLAKRVVTTDTEVDRLNWLVFHQYNIVSRDANLIAKMGMTIEDANFYFLVSRLIERIADHASRIAKNSIRINKPSKEMKDDISRASEAAIELLNGSLGAWFKKDPMEANNVLGRVTPLVDECRNISDAAREKTTAKGIPAAYIAESIRRTGEYSGDIAEIAMNYLIKEV
ncbi:MAG: phosphate uptake regulator PhoU [Thermoplasmata archaeon]|nr:phosphate uptake regulator PhoU [Thermoplasmata archaeon]